MRIKINILTLALMLISLGGSLKGGAYLSEHYQATGRASYDVQALGNLTAQQSWVNPDTMIDAREDYIKLPAKPGRV